MPFVKCSVDGCNARIQPLLKPDPGYREDWVYPECDVCFRPVCAKHATEEDGRIVCDRCRRAQKARGGEGLIQLGMLPPTRAGKQT